jgi:hypothetical protein
MALIKVHKVMIGTALVFCGMFSVRGFVTGDLTTGGAFAVVTVGLLGYFRWFLAKRADAPQD